MCNPSRWTFFSKCCSFITSCSSFASFISLSYFISAEEVEEVVVTPPVPVVETVAETTELTEEQSLLADYTNLSLKCQQAAAILSSMKKELLALEKKTNRVLRTIKKTSGKRKSKSGNKQIRKSKNRSRKLST